MRLRSVISSVLVMNIVSAAQVYAVPADAPAYIRLLNNSGGKFSPQLRNAYMANSEKSLRASTKLPDEFWKWLANHPQIKDGLYAATDPVLPVYAQNLNTLREALGHPIADKYPQLLLAVALQEEAIDPDAPEISPSDTDANVTALVQYMQSKHLTLLELVNKGDTALTEAGIDLKKADRKNIYTRVGIASGTYPQRGKGNTVDWLRGLIARYETKLPTYAKGPQWPMFPLDKAPWPILLPMQQTLPKREVDYIWDHFTDKTPYPNGERFHTYGKYTWDYELPENKYKQSDWNPNSLPRIVEDGGVCGRLSTFGQFTYLSLAQPAVGMAQPGHRALLVYNYNEKSGYTAQMQQAISGPMESHCEWLMPGTEPMRSGINRSLNTGPEYYFGTALAVNLGLDRYMNTRIAVHIANSLPDSAVAQKISLLESAGNINPYNVTIWYTLAKLPVADLSKVNVWLAKIDDLIAHPNAGVVKEPSLSATTDFSKVKEVETDKADIKNANQIAAVLTEVITKNAYTQALTQKPKLSANYKLLQDEIARREKIGQSYNWPVKLLATQYQVALQGPANEQKIITEKMANYVKLPEKSRNKSSEELTDTIDAIAPAITDPSERVAWLQSLRDLYSPTDLYTTKDGSQQIEKVYQYIYNQQIKAYKSNTKKYADQLHTLKEAYEKLTITIPVKPLVPLAGALK